MTKPWTSVAAMMLVEDGSIQLTEPVSKCLPALKGLKVSVARPDPGGASAWTLVPADREPTIQDLLRHAQGFAYDFVTANAPVKEAHVGSKLEALKGEIRDVITASEMVERLSKAPLAFQPGTTWDFSLSTAILGRVIEAVSGMRLSRFLEERIFAPLRMTDSGFSVPQDKGGRIAQPLMPYAVIQIFDPTVPPANDLGGEGGMSTASDYLRFDQMLLDGGKLGNARIPSRSTVALMTADHLGPNIAAPIHPGQILLGVPGYTFGLGFMVRQGAGVPGSPGEFMWGAPPEPSSGWIPRSSWRWCTCRRGRSAGGPTAAGS